MLFSAFVFLVAVTVTGSPIDYYAVDAAGGLSKFTQITTGPTIDMVFALTRLDYVVYQKLVNSIVPRARGNAVDPIRDYARSCVRMVMKELDPTISVLKATIWCLVASKNGADPKLNLVLSDETFAEIAAPLVSRLAHQTPPAPQSPPEIPNTFSNWRDAIWNFDPEFFKLNRKKIANSELVSAAFWANRISSRNAVSLTPPVPGTIAAGIRDFIESIPRARRLAILDVIIDTKLKRNLYDRVSEITTSPEEQSYANYILSSLFIPELIVRFFSSFIGDHLGSQNLATPHSAFDIVDLFVRTDPHFKYITPERLLEWFRLLTTSKTIGFIKIVDDEETLQLPNHIPRLSFWLDIWKTSIVIPRRDRLASTGTESLY